MILTNKIIPCSFLLTVFFLCAIYIVPAQPKLILSKLGKRSKIIFYEGDQIWIKVNGESNYVGGFIIGLRDSTIRFRYFEIPVKEITEVNIDGKSLGGFNVGQYGPLIAVAGPLYMGIDYLNQGEITTRTVIQTAAISGIGYGLWKIRRKKFKIRKRNRIHIIK